MSINATHVYSLSIPSSIFLGLVFASESATATAEDVDHLLPAMVNRLLEKKGRAALKKFLLKIAKVRIVI